MNQPLRRIADLVPGARYRIRETFADFDGDELLAGTELTFVERSYFPYDGGHTLTFAERVVRLAEIDPNSSRVIDAPGRWFECVDPDQGCRWRPLDTPHARRGARPASRNEGRISLRRRRPRLFAPMRSLAIACLVGLAPLSAQSVSASLVAATPVTLSATDSGSTTTVALPAGPMTSFGTLAAQAPAGQAFAFLMWQTVSGPNSSSLLLEHWLGNPAGSPTFDGQAGPHEFLLTFTSATPRNARLVATRSTDASPGVAWPTVRLDVDDDGAFETNSLPTVTPAEFAVSFGPQPLVVRVIVAASLGAGANLRNLVSLRLLPDNDLDITVPVVGCFQSTPTPPPVLQASFDDRGIDVSPMTELAPSFAVFGFSPQPQLIGTFGSAPCLLLPSPDAIVLLPDHPIHLPIPASVRPVTLFVQVVQALPEGLVSSDGFVVIAN